MSRALLIVDIQHDYFTGGAVPLHEPEEAARVASLVVEAFRDSAEPIFHTQRVQDGPGAAFLAAGTDGAGLYAAVQPEGGEPVVTRSAASAFHGTDLEAQLRAAGVSELIVVGMAVDDTVRAAAGLGFSVLLVDDATSAPDQPVDGLAAASHAEFLTALSDSARIVASHELI